MEGGYYDKTLMAWWDRFDATWNQLKGKYDDVFYQMWKLYLQGCAGGFRANRMRVWQMVFSRGDLPDYGGPYAAINVNCLDDVDPSEITAAYWDGRHDNWQAGTSSKPWPFEPTRMAAV